MENKDFGIVTIMVVILNGNWQIKFSRVYEKCSLGT